MTLDHLTKYRTTTHFVISLLFFGFCLLPSKLQAELYQVNIDLTDNQNGFKVEIFLPELEYPNKTLYTIPISSYGNFKDLVLEDYITDIEVFDRDYKPLKFLYWKDYHIVVDKAKYLHKIQYRVKDFKSLRHKFNLPQNGVTIDKNELYLLYSSFFIGYLEEILDLPYRVNIQYPDGVFTTNPLAKRKGKTLDAYKLENYAALIRNPIFYAKLDTLTFENRGIKTHLAVYSTNGLQTADNLERILYPIIGDFQRAADSLALKTYRFNFFFRPVKSNEPLQYGGFFHNESSFFLLPEQTNRFQQIDEIQKLTAHELMHTLCPYHLHSDKMTNIQYLNSEEKMSQHLWLYEGVTEYLSLQLLVKNKRIKKEQFFSDFSKKIQIQSRFPDISLIEASENMFQPRYQKYFSNFYHKGALVAFMLDNRLQSNTGGKKTLLSLVLELCKRYGSEKSFKENQLLEEMLDLGVPELRFLFDEYLFKKSKLPINAYLEKIGYYFYTNYEEKRGSYGLFKVKADIKTKRFRFVEVRKNELGLKEGDYLLSINEDDLGSYQTYLQMIDLLKRPEAGAPIRLVVERDGKKVKLSANAFAYYKDKENVIRPLEKATPDQLSLRAKMLE